MTMLAYTPNLSDTGERELRRRIDASVSRALFDELLDAPIDQGAKAVVNAHGNGTLEIDTDEKGITVDIDTPELYRQHVKGE